MVHMAWCVICSLAHDIHVMSLEPVLCFTSCLMKGGAAASLLVCSSPDEVVQVEAPASDIVLWYWARHLTHTVPLSTQVY